MAKPLEIPVTQAELKALLTYFPETGEFVWNYCADKSQYWNSRFSGKKAGSHHERSVVIRFDGRGYKAHRLAFLYMLGFVPYEIDHINQNPFDNRWDNLREVSHQENARNARQQRNNSSGVTGVVWHNASGKWAATIGVDYGKKHLGLFENFNDAVTARKQAEARYGFSNA